MPGQLASDPASLVDHLATGLRLHAIAESAFVPLNVTLANSRVHGWLNRREIERRRRLILVDLKIPSSAL